MLRKSLFLTLCFISLSACSEKPDYKESLKSIKTDMKSELLTDLLDKNKYAPPYQDYEPLIRSAKTCKEAFFDNEPMLVEYLRIGIKEEALGLAAGRNGVLSEIIKNSGGTIALSEEITPEIIYLYNLRMSKNKSAEKAYNKFKKSPQVTKTEDFLNNILKTKEVSNDEKLKSIMFQVCLQIDLSYTMLGGTEYSNTADIYPNVKKIVRSQSNIGKSTLLNKIHN